MTITAPQLSDFGKAAMGAVLMLGATAGASAAATPSMDLATAQALAAKAEKTVEAHHMGGAIDIVDAAGNQVLFLRLDGATAGNLKLAPQKARSAADFGIPTQNFADQLSKGDVSVLGNKLAVALPGGEPVKVDGVLIGGIGVSTPDGKVDQEAAEAAVADEVAAK